MKATATKKSEDLIRITVDIEMTGREITYIEQDAERCAWTAPQDILRAVVKAAKGEV